jgi:hypothetical protein
MILALKFSESHPLSLQTIPILMIVAFVLLCACVLGEFILESTYVDFNTKYTSIPIFIFVSNSRGSWYVL